MAQFDITPLSTKLTDSNLDYINADKLNDNGDIIAVYNDNNTTYIRVYNVNETTGAVTGVGSEVVMNNGGTGGTYGPLPLRLLMALMLLQ